jgi:hypothetical protein
MATMKRLGMYVLVTGIFVATSGQVSLAPWSSGPLLFAQDTFRLVSAQVVTRSEGPPSLRFAANGPIAFTVLPPSEGEAAGPNRIKARLHGVVPGNLATTDLAPYAVVASADGQDTILTVTAPSTLKLALRAGARSSELTVVATVTP